MPMDRVVPKTAQITSVTQIKWKNVEILPEKARPIFFCFRRDTVLVATHTERERATFGWALGDDISDHSIYSHHFGHSPVMVTKAGTPIRIANRSCGVTRRRALAPERMCFSPWLCYGAITPATRSLQYT